MPLGSGVFFAEGDDLSYPVAKKPFPSASFLFFDIKGMIGFDIPRAGVRGSSMSMYCTLSHRKIRGWGHLRLVEQHNARDIDTPSREDDAPMPIEQLAGDGDMVDRTRALLTAKDVPHKLRKNTVLAYEDVYGASPGYWEARYPDGWKNAPVEVLERDPLAVALMQHVKTKYGEKLVSVRLHLDEKSPHWHVVSVPLVTSLHKQRGRKRKDGVVPEPIMKTTLYASHVTERGGSGRRLEVEHDEWSEATKHLGLVRGARGSDLTKEEKRDRRLRDTQSSRQGEDRARVRKEERGRSDAAETLMVAAASDFARIVGQGTTDASAIVADARAEADRVLADADRIKAEAEAAAEKTKLDAETAARVVADGIKAQAESDADTIRNDVRAEAERQASEDRKGIDADRRRVDRDMTDVRNRATAIRHREDVLTKRETRMDEQAGLLAGLLEKLGPMLAVVTKAHERLQNAPDQVRRWLDGDGRVGEVVETVGPIIAQATEALRKLVKRPQVAQPAPAEDVDLATQKAMLDRLTGRDGK